MPTAELITAVALPTLATPPTAIVTRVQGDGAMAFTPQQPLATNTAIGGSFEKRYGKRNLR